ncbi:MAG: carboxylic ester hydrolase [Anaerolineae bacterium]|nr:MAG: carboxylic ester hydrolase [Anaerolineae bacterium]
MLRVNWSCVCSPNYFMRPLEILLLFITSLLLILTIFRPDLPHKFFLGAAAVLIIFLLSHLIIEGYRWQMAPIYFTAIGMTMAAILLLTTQQPFSFSLITRGALALAGLAALFLGLFFGTVLPITKLPAPTGPYKVGTTTFLLEDKDREELYSTDPNDRREFMVQLWYPIDPDFSAEKSQYVGNLDIVGPALADRLDLPRFLLGHLNLIKTNSLINAPLTLEGEQFPLILFSHGVMGIRMQNTFMMEELASNGYIVASPDHTYDAVFTVMPDERVIFHDAQALFPKDESRVTSGRRLIEVRKDDLSSIIDEMDRLNLDASSIFFNRIGLNKIGLAGHSAGGGTVLSSCLQEEFCDVVIALDSWVEPIIEDELSNQLIVPALYMNSAEWLGIDNREGGLALAFGASAPGIIVTIEGANHNDFTDIPLLSPMARFLGLAGTINSQKVHRIINDYSIAFLDHFLRGEAGTLDDLSLPKYPEAFVEFHEP